MRILLLLLLFVSALPALADPFTDAERETGVPSELLVAVAKTESGLSPYSFAVWSIKKDPLLAAYCSRERKIRSRFGNYLYNGCFFKRRKEAEKFLSYLLSSPTVSNFSVGLMQINSSWVETLEVSPYDFLDPEINVLLGALILKFYYEVEKDWGRALSRYYGKQKGIAWKYVSKVVENLDISGK